jgi:protein O-GlcNAc transferase
MTSLSKIHQLLSAGDFLVAERECRLAISQGNEIGEATLLLARVLEAKGLQAARSGDWQTARQAMQQALEIQPCWSAVWNNLSNVFRRLGQFEEAERCLLRAVAFAPQDADYYLNLGHLYASANKFAQAEMCYRQAQRLAPENMIAIRGLHELMERQGRTEEVAELLQAWAKAEPQNPDPLIRLGILHKEAERHEAAEEAWLQARAARPQEIATYGNLGQSQAERGFFEQAEQTFREGIRYGGRGSLEILAASCLPTILENESQIATVRQKVLGNLQELVNRGVHVDTTRERMPTLFFLAYHGENDRPFHETMAQLSTMHRYGKQTLPKRPAGKKLRLGIASHFLRDHTIGRLNIGLFEKLSRDNFEVVAIPCQQNRDPFAQRLLKYADQTIHLPADVGAALETLKSLQLDLLYYCDIGMMPYSYTLAFQRVAPVQLVTWGHPVTTGLPTIDYFVSSEALEPAGSEAFYTEQLLRLSRLSVYYEPPEPRGVVSPESFGVSAREHVYVCPQTLFKFHPRFDEILAGILRGDPNGVLLLLEGRFPEWQSMLLKRWQRNMPDVISRIRFLPKQPRPRFLDLLSISHVMLDPIVFGGGNTSYEALGLGLPVVTQPDPFLRSRLTAAMYHQMGWTELVANSPKKYIEIALKLGMNPDYRAYCSREIQARSTEIFHDAAAVTDLENALLECWEKRL